jgi:hypothetical protein
MIDMEDSTSTNIGNGIDHPHCNLVRKCYIRSLPFQFFHSAHIIERIILLS